MPKTFDARESAASITAQQKRVERMTPKQRKELHDKALAAPAQTSLTPKAAAAAVGLTDRQVQQAAKAQLRRDRVGIKAAVEDLKSNKPATRRAAIQAITEIAFPGVKQPFTAAKDREQFATLVSGLVQNKSRIALSGIDDVIASVAERHDLKSLLAGGVPDEIKQRLDALVVA